MAARVDKLRGNTRRAREMWTVIFLITTVICGIGWLKRYVSCAALIHFMKMKGYSLPNDEEIEECVRFTVKDPRCDRNDL